MSASDEMIIQDIRDELVRARHKFPTNRHQLAAFNEEAGELTKAMLDYECEHKRNIVSPEDIYYEAVQAAAMAIRVATEGDSDFKYILDKDGLTYS